MHIYSSRRTPRLPVQRVAIDGHDQLRPKLSLYHHPITTAFLPSYEQKRSTWSKTKKLRSKKGSDNKRHARRGTEEHDDDDDDDDDDDEDQEMEVATRHEELVYWYTGFEDPNCIAVVELVATVMDTGNGIQARFLRSSADLDMYLPSEQDMMRLTKPNCPAAARNPGLLQHVSFVPSSTEICGDQKSKPDRKVLRLNNFAMFALAPCPPLLRNKFRRGSTGAVGPSFNSSGRTSQRQCSTGTSTGGPRGTFFSSNR